MPPGKLIIYFPDNNIDTLYIGYDKEVKIFLKPTETGFSRFLIEDIGIGNDTVLITNRGKLLTKLFFKAEIEKCKVIDVFINEKLINIAEGSEGNTALEELFKKYEINGDLDVIEKIFQINSLYEKQLEEITSHGLQQITDIENEVQWIVSKMEYRGLNINSDNSNNEMPTSILEYIKEDGRFYDEINQLNINGRMSSKLHCTTVDNLLENIVLPGEGNVFVKADYSQFELRILAGLSNDSNMIGLFKNNIDVYSYLAQKNTEINGTEYERSEAKRFVLRVINGGGKDSEWFRIFSSEFPKTVKWLDENVVKVRNNGYVSSVLGRKRKVDSSISDSSILNYVIRSTGADGFKLALIELDRQLKPYDAEIVHTVHDEIIVESPSIMAPEISEIVKEVMEGVFTGMFPEVPFKVEETIQQSV